MKKFLLLGVIAIVFASCETISPQPTGIKGYDYVFKKKHGKILTGVEEKLAGGKRRSFISIEYEKITTGFNNTFFLVHQGNGAKVINQNKKFELDGLIIKPESIKYLGNRFYIASEDGFQFEDINGKKYWWFTFHHLFSGYDDLIPCVNGFIFKKGNKYGFAKFHASYNTLQYSHTVTQKFEVTLSEKYDALYEIVNEFGYGRYCFLAKLGDKWMVLDASGRPAKRYYPRINKNLTKLPIKEKAKTHPISGALLEDVVRFGQENAGYITFSIYEARWAPYFE